MNKRDMYESSKKQDWIHQKLKPFFCQTRINMYLFTMQHEYRFTVPGVDMAINVYLNPKTGDPLFAVNGDQCTIYPGYSWDGCSPRFKLFGKSFGTYNGPIESYIIHKTGDIIEAPQLYFPSAEHDCFCQFQPAGITRKQADKHFYRSMVARKWKRAKTYYRAVRCWSKINGEG